MTLRCAIAGLAVLLWSGCGGTNTPAGDSNLCTPGESVSCACPNGTTSAQVCKVDGTFDVCACIATNYLGTWKHLQIRNTGNNNIQDWNSFYVDANGNFGVGLLGSTTQDSIVGNIGANGQLTAVMNTDGNACNFTGTCVTVNFCWGNINPACANYDVFTMFR